MLIFIPLLALLLLVCNLILSPNNPDMEKISSYECGMPIVPDQVRMQFSISYWLITLLFLIFDLEVALVFPSAVSMHLLELYGYYILMLFFLMLGLGFIYEWASGAIKSILNN